MIAETTAETAEAAASSVCAITTEAELNRLAEDWNRLAGPVPFRRWDWLAASWSNFRTPTRTLFVPTVRAASGELVGLAPWYMEVSPLCGRTLRFLGSDEACSDYLSVLAEPDRRREVTAAIADWLTNDAAGEWDLLELTGVDAEDETVHSLLDELAARGHAIHSRDGLNCWRLALPGDWEDYLASLSRNRRQMCRSMYRKTFGAGRALLRLADDPRSFDEGFAVLVDLHQRRRRSLGQPGCFADHRFYEFLRTAGRRLLERKALRLQWIESDGVPVAADIDLLGDGCIYGYQCGINPDRPKIRAGLLMMCANLKRAIAEGYTAVDFLRGNEKYKARWGAQPRRMLDVRVVPPQAVPRMRHAFWSTGKKFGRWIKGRRQAGESGDSNTP